ncbi:MAG: DUF1573 domain-containing protein [Kiritimatiellia bacterium]|jgi:hypothetical protein
MCRWQTCLAGVFLALVATAQPKLECDAPVFQFPPTDNSLEVFHTFILRNAGSAPLIIHRVRPDCGCLLAHAPSEAIAPGAEFELAARLNLKGRRGNQTRRITIFSNAPCCPQLVLMMEGEALAPVGVYPERLLWGNIRGDRIAERSVMVEFRGAGEGSIREVSINHPHFTTEVDVVNTGQTYRVVFCTVPPLAPGRFSLPVTIHTDHPKTKKLSLQMSGRVVEAVFAIPDELVLSLPQAGEGAPVTTDALAVLRVLDQTPFQVLEVIPPAAGITVQQRRLSQGGMRLELQNIPLTPELDGSRVVIRTDRTDVPEIVIPLRVEKGDSQ